MCSNLLVNALKEMMVFVEDIMWYCDGIAW